MISSGRVKVNGIELAYEEAGHGDRAFVLVHGFTGCKQDFDLQLPALAKRGLTIAIDQRGQGDSDRADRATYHFGQLADDLRGFADALELERFDLLGHSMGGMVAQRFTLANPDRVASLVLMDTAAASLGDRMPRDMFEKGAALARAAGMEKLHEIIRSNAGNNPMRTEPDRRLEKEMGEERYWGRIRKAFTSMDVEAFEALGLQLTSAEPTLARLGEIQCPTTVLVGAEDKPFIAASKAMHEAIAGSQLVVIPDAGHCPQTEAPEAWIAAIEGHLDWARTERKHA
jgi:2-succinyl-6-hydroxy-2,4-cyclohexadiene-1-carboxylate synthase